YIKRGDLNIGLVSHLSENGCGVQLGREGILEEEALSFAIDIMNGRSDLLPNISLGMVVFDGCSDMGATLARMVYFLEDNQGSGWTSEFQQKNWPPSMDDFPPMNFPVKGMTGIWSSTTAVHVAGFLGAFGIPLISNYATSDQLSDPLRFPHFMRMVMPDRFSLNALTQIASSMNWTYVSLVYSEGAYGESGAKYLEKLLKKHSPKMCLAYSRRVSSDADDNEYLEVIEQLAQLNARVIFIWCQQHHQHGLQMALKRLGLVHSFVFLGGDNFVMDGSIAPAAFKVDHIQEKIPGFAMHMEQLRPWENKDNPWLPWVWSETFGCSWLPSSNNSCYDHPQLSLTEFQLWHITPHTRLYQSIIVYAKAFHEMILDRCPEQFAQPDRQVLQNCVQTSMVIDYLLNVSFPGLSHQIHFDSKGDIYGQYFIKHTVREGPHGNIVVGKWDRYTGDLSLNLSLLNFDALRGKDFFEPEFEDMYIPVSVCSRSCPRRHQSVRQDLECCWECYKCRNNERLVGNGTLCEACPQHFWPSKEDDSQCERIAPTYLMASDLTSIGLVLLASVGACLAVALAGLFYWRRNHRLVRATSRELSSVIILGALLTFANAFLFVMKPSKLVCVVRMLGFHLTINMLFSPLTVKTLRIYRIFYMGKRSAQKPKFISTPSQLVFTGIILLLQIGMVIISNSISTISPGLLQQVKTKPFVELRCEQALPAFLLPICFNVALILLCAVLGYLTRKLPENFNESWYIFVSVSTTLFAWSVFLPTYFSVFYAYQQAALLSFCLLLNAFITVGCLFLPRAYAI
ncbi:hypothetical protein CAPTEDRAFT_72291, partial [Capitella teleta]